jgi:hypothetical protein
LLQKPPSSRVRVMSDKNLGTLNSTIPAVDFSDKNKLEAEFEFFNLDAEYDKNLQSNDASKLRKHTQQNVKNIEYNLDIEFNIS